MRWARRGELPCIVLRRGRDGRAAVVRFEPAAIEAFIASRRQGASK